MNKSYNIDINEIIFEGKNKDYGAYVLRGLYKKHLTVALWAAIILFTLAVSSPLIYQAVKPKDDVKLNRKRVVQITQLAEPPSIGEKKEIEKVEAPPPLKSTIKFTPPVVKPDEQVTEDYIPTVEELHNVDPGASTQKGQEGGVDYSLIEVEEPEQKIVKEEAKEEPFTYVEEMPAYPGGDEALLTFISGKIQYPEIARRAGVEGRVFVSFVVEKNGEVTEVKLQKGIGAGCDEEAVRVIKMMGKWKPGKQNGRPARVRIIVPILFKLQ